MATRYASRPREVRPVCPATSPVVHACQLPRARVNDEFGRHAEPGDNGLRLRFSSLQDGRRTLPVCPTARRAGHPAGRYRGINPPESQRAEPEPESSCSFSSWVSRATAEWRASTSRSAVRASADAPNARRWWARRKASDSSKRAVLNSSRRDCKSRSKFMAGASARPIGLSCQ